MQPRSLSRVSSNLSVWSDCSTLASCCAEFSKDGERCREMCSSRCCKEVCCIDIEGIAKKEGSTCDYGNDDIKRDRYSTTTLSITTTITEKEDTNQRGDRTIQREPESLWNKLQKITSLSSRQRTPEYPSEKDVTILSRSKTSTYPTDIKSPFHTPGFSAAPSTPGPPPPPQTPITCTFQLPTHTYTRRIPYPIYRRWESFSSLLQILSDDFGTPVLRLWDWREGMEVQSGDWEARVRPGWEVVIECGELDEDDDDDDEGDWNESDEKEDESTNKTWWFIAWRKKVESGGKGKITLGRGGRAWLLGILGVIALIALVL